MDFLTAGGAKWFETLPFVVGLLFAVVEILVRWWRSRVPVISAPDLGYMLGEGVSICVMPIYGGSLIFNPTLAVEIADKNGKVLAVAMLVAVVTLWIHIWNRWWSVHE